MLARFLIAAVSLAVCAYLYNRWITGQEKRGRHDGYVSLYVVGGVLLVLAHGAFVVWPLGDQARLTLAIISGLFIPAGVPMIIGSITRHLDSRERAEDAVREMLEE